MKMTIPVKITTDPRYSHLTIHNNGALVKSAVQRVESLMQDAHRAAHLDAAAGNGVIYAKPASPLLSFLVPKTGSNTVLHYHLQALAAVGAVTNLGCQPPDRHSCLSHMANTSCHVAFANHYRPRELIDALITADRQPHTACR